MEILKVHNLKKYFGGVHAVDGLNLGVEEGTITSIIGPNGSGKSSLMNVLSGVYSIDGGTVSFDGVTLQDIKPWNVASYGLTRTFQEVRLFEQMTVLDNVLVVLTERVALAALGETLSEIHKNHAETVLKRVGLWEKRSALCSQLSYGQRKLLEIARVLAMDKKILLFDEPFAGLFPQMVKEVVVILKELRQEHKTIVLIEHNMELIRELSNEVIVIDEGKLLAKGKPETVLRKKEVIEAYLGE